MMECLECVATNSKLGGGKIKLAVLPGWAAPVPLCQFHYKQIATPDIEVDDVNKRRKEAK